MPTDDDFLRAIIADPDADAPRLAYADWLEDGGDADRAEFIRVQCALAAMPEGRRAFHPLLDRERELVQEHADDWLRPLRAVVGAESGRPGWRGWFRRLVPKAGGSWTFRRGFAEVLSIDAGGWITHSAELCRLTPLRELALDYTGYGMDLGPLGNCPELSRITSLSLALTEFDEPPPLRPLIDNPHLAQLKRLSLRCVGFDAGDLALLAVSTLFGRLQRLGLAAERNVPFDALQPLLQTPACQRLGSLSLCGIWPANDTDRVLAALPAFECLTRLDVSWNALGDCDILQLLDRLPATLTHLDLPRTVLSNARAASLALSPRLRQLLTLDLSNNLITDSGALALADSPNLVVTTRLDLTGNPISERVKNALRIRLQHQVTV